MRHLRSCISFFTSTGSCLASLTAKFISTVALIALSSASMANTISWGTFDGTSIDGDTYTFPSSAQAWAGFSKNNDPSLYPFCFGDGGSVSFTGAVPSDGSATVSFVFEYNPYPDTTPNITNLTASVSGSAELGYTVPVPAQPAENTYSSFVMYIAERDIPVVIKDVTVSSTACPTVNYSLSLTVTSVGASQVYFASDIDGRSIGNPADAIPATDNGDGTWTATVDSISGSFQYQWISDEASEFPEVENLVSQNDSGLCEQENLVDGVAFRQYVAPEGGISGDVNIVGDIYNTCNALDTDNDGTPDLIDNDDDNDGIEDANDPLPLDDDPNFTNVSAAAFSEAFGDTEIGEGLAYLHPASAQAWGGFANMNASLYPLKLTEAGTITFNASVPSGGSADIRFRFEANPYPATEPSFNTDAVTVAGADVTSYTINVPAQGANTFNSLLMYIGSAPETPDTDVAVVITDVIANVDLGQTDGW
jgi:hypothetical protein